MIDGLEKKTANRYIEIYSVVEKTAVDIGVAMTQLIKHCIIVYAYVQTNIFTIVLWWISYQSKIKHVM